MLAFLSIIKRSSLRTADVRGLLVGIVKGVMTVLDNDGVLFPFLPVDLAKFVEESGVDALVDPGVSTTNGFVVELDNMM
eukprot:12165310-Ditylum_brightwellii.AAC.1